MKSRRSRITAILLSLAFLGVIAVGFGFWHAGYRVYVIHTGSMMPTADPGDLVIDAPASGPYRPGQIITFRHSAAPDLVTHRITDITADGGMHTKGDANPTADTWTITPAMVVGRVDAHVPNLGYFVVFLQQPAGFGSLFAALIGLVLLWGLFFPPPPVTPKGSHTRLPERSNAVGDGDSPMTSLSSAPMNTLDPATVIN